MILFDFDSEAECNSWVPINDVVMGGVSRSRFEYDGESIGVFSGTVSLVHSGGFASIRSMPSSFDLRGHSGLCLRVRGDGKQYKVNLRTEGFPDGIQYQAVFWTKAGTWSEIKIPFSAFVPKFRGAHAYSFPPLDTASICSFGFLISDKQEGSFRLDIDSIGTYR